MILMLIRRGSGALVRGGDIMVRCLVACCGHMILHGMGTLVHAIDRDGKHRHQEKYRKELEAYQFAHN